MGLDFKQADAHWSYGGFNRFRERIVASLGFDWNKMTGDFIGKIPPDEAENDRFLALNDPITPLIMHSDCEGDLSPEECARVAPRLEEIIKPWPDGDYDKAQALELARGMRECAEKGEALEFC